MHTESGFVYFRQGPNFPSEAFGNRGVPAAGCSKAGKLVFGFGLGLPKHDASIEVKIESLITRNLAYRGNTELLILFGRDKESTGVGGRFHISHRHEH